MSRPVELRPPRQSMVVYGNPTHCWEPVENRYVYRCSACGGEFSVAGVYTGLTESEMEARERDCPAGDAA